MSVDRDLYSKILTFTDSGYCQHQQWRALLSQQNVRDGDMVGLNMIDVEATTAANDSGDCSVGVGAVAPYGHTAPELNHWRWRPLVLDSEFGGLQVVTLLRLSPALIRASDFVN